jgi:hypothetical protein
MEFTSLIFLTTGVILVWRLIALGTRTANANEASAPLALVTLVAALSPEARVRASAAIDRICDEVDARPVEGDRR